MLRSVRAARIPVIALLALVIGCTTPPPTDGELVALKLLESQRDAWNRGDLDGFVAEAYWEAPELTFMSAADWQRGYQELVTRYNRTYGGDRERMGTLDFSDLETSPLGDAHVMVRGRWHLEYTDREDIHGLFTLIFRNTGDGWRIIHDHTSRAPAQFPEEEPAEKQPAERQPTQPTRPTREDQGS